MGVSKKDLRRILAPRPQPLGGSRNRPDAIPATALAFPMEPTDGNVSKAMAAGMRCVHCGSADHWRRGPRGGLHQNVTCGCCGQGVNACATVPELSHALNERTDPALRASYEAEGRTVRNRAGDGTVAVPTGGTVH